MPRMGAPAAAPIPACLPRTPIRGRRSHRSRHSCRRSCGARLHFVRHCLAQCAPQRRPLNRRGGSPPPGSPASISRSPVQRKSGFRPAGAGFGVTPHASLMQGCQWAHCPVVSGTLAVSRGPGIVGASAMRPPCADRHRPGVGCPRLSPAPCARNARFQRCHAAQCVPFAGIRPRARRHALQAPMPQRHAPLMAVCNRHPEIGRALTTSSSLSHAARLHTNTLPNDQGGPRVGQRSFLSWRRPWRLAVPTQQRAAGCTLLSRRSWL